ncbi:MAG: baseplate assembly protein [Rhodanobacter sp. 68-29]|nr:MAG: baseplate assembly protein [Rhodanobacter sp. SCN 69-32]OJY55427.1 MAG: baseplate assembly protein [Rhodanobacter sp. 68-29]
MSAVMNRFYGKYRGTVIQNVDPEQRGRIQAMVPDVSGLLPSSWAMPCVPFAGKQSGVYVVPQIGAGVWIEFEQGDPDYPVWTGGYWGSAAEVPVLALAGNPASPSVVLQTGLQNLISISDVPGPTGGILLKSASGAMVMINDTGITISNGKGATIVLAGPTVTINNGALAVT